MQKSKNAFTMIELIFVIIILGILAAVAMPKLAGTRDDAEVSKMASDVVTVLNDVGVYYTSQGSMPTNWSDMTNVELESAPGTKSTVVSVPAKLYDGSNECIVYDINTSVLTISAGAVTTAGSICKAVQDLETGVIGSHQFAGISVIK